MPKLTIDGVEVEVAAGTSVLEAAKQAGAEVPHYCYHPGLSIAGQCRLCMVDVDKVPRPQISCNMTVADGMVVHTKTERVVETRRSVMEFHLINHPLDCPVCDQAGECWLQIYYMRHGLYDPRMADEKVHKPKAMPLGPHVILDAERCILCSRCVRFCDEVTGTGELGIFHRGRSLRDRPLPGQDAREQVLEQRDRHLPGGRAHRPRLPLPGARLVPRHGQVGVQWLRPRLQCRDPHEPPAPASQPGQAGGPDSSPATMPRSTSGGSATRAATAFRLDRRRVPAHRADRRGKRGRAVATTWDAALAALGDALRRYRPEEIGILASPQMSNEDLFALKRLADQFHLANVDHRVPPAAPGDQDDFLIRADKTPEHAWRRAHRALARSGRARRGGDARGRGRGAA